MCQLWVGILVVNPALKLKTAHAHMRVNVVGARRWGSVVLMLGTVVNGDLRCTGIGLASSGVVCKSRLTSRSDTQRLVVQLSSWLRRLFIHVLSLSVCPGK